MSILRTRIIYIYILYIYIYIYNIYIRIHTYTIYVICTAAWFNSSGSYSYGGFSLSNSRSCNGEVNEEEEFEVTSADDAATPGPTAVPRGLLLLPLLPPLIASLEPPVVPYPRPPPTPPPPPPPPRPENSEEDEAHNLSVSLSDEDNEDKEEGGGREASALLLLLLLPSSWARGLLPASASPSASATPSFSPPVVARVTPP